MPALAKIFGVGAVSGGVMVVAMWLFHAEQSPAYEYFLWHTSIANAITTLNLPALFLGIVVSGNVHQPSELATYAGVFVQWAVLGSVIAWLVLRWSAFWQSRSSDA